MNRSAGTAFAALLATALMVALAGCSSSGDDDPTPPAPPTLYDRIVVGTYDPTGSSVEAITKVSLYDVSGTQIGITANDQLDYSTTQLSSGTYYALVESRSLSTGPYAFRVLTLALGAPIPAPDYFGTDSADPDAYEPDDDSPVPPLGASPDPADIAPGGELNRYLSDTSGKDWFRITLP